MGGIGLGLWGAAGTAILVFGFQLDPGSPPVDAFFIIIAVITASAAMQAAGGIDWLVMIASRIIQANPSRITLVAPLVSFVFTVGAGTSNIYFALIPVIHETAYRNGIRPEKPLASSTVTSALGITASPVSAAMAAYLTLLPEDFTLPDILKITIPAAIVSCIVTALVQQRIGKELWEDPEYLRRVEAGEVEVPEKIMAKLPAATRAAAIAAATARPGDIGDRWDNRLDRGSPGCTDDRRRLRRCRRYPREGDVRRSSSWPGWSSSSSWVCSRACARPSVRARTQHP